MQKLKFQHLSKGGFTLIEMLAFLFVFSVITVAFYATWTTGTRYILLAKNRLIANALANEKMEVVRNLAFEDVALTTSVPPGNLSQNEDVTRSGLTFHVFTQIRNEDDPYDGLYPHDTIGGFVDYKYVKITISWEGGDQSVATSSRFVPAGIEQPSTGLGILVVNVTSDKNQNALVPQSNVRIKNADTGLDETHSTDNFGRLVMVGLAESFKKYEITLSKNGWETVSTMPPYPDSPYNPIHEHASVVTEAGAVNKIDMFQNELADFSIHTVDYLENDLGSMNYYLKGGQQLGTEADGSYDLVYNLDEHQETGADGKKNYGKISPGQYEFTLEESGYKIIGINPITIINPVASFSLLCGETLTLAVKASRENVTALLVKVAKEGDGLPMAGASVKLTNGSGYDTTVTTGDDGMAFFPNAENPPFAAGVYNVTITAAGYQDYSDPVTIIENNLKEKAVSMFSS